MRMCSGRPLRNSTESVGRRSSDFRRNSSTEKNAGVAHEIRWKAQFRVRRRQRVGLQCGGRDSRSDASHSNESSTYNRSRHIGIRECGLEHKETQVLARVANENF